MLKCLLAWVSGLNSTDKHGYSKLLRAAEHGNVEKVRKLLSKSKLKVNAANQYGDTALHLASLNGHVEVVKELLTHPDIAVNAQSKDNGNTALMAACDNSQIEVVKLLVADPRINVNIKNRKGRNALHFAVMSGMREVIKLLLAKGIDAKAKDLEGKSAVQMAGDRKFDDVVDLILKYLGYPEYSEQA